MLRRSKFIVTGLSLFVVFAFSSFAKVTAGKNFRKIISGKDTLTELRTIKINDDYSVDIQKHMYEDTLLNNEASLEYADTVNELYIIVIDEPKADFIVNYKTDKLYKWKNSLASNYRAIQMARLKENVKMKGREKIKSEVIQNRPAQIVSCTAKVSGMVYFKIGFFAGEDTLYMVMCWTLAEYKDRHNAEMDQMIHSFRMIKYGTD